MDKSEKGFSRSLGMPAGDVGMNRDDRWIGLFDGGIGLECWLQQTLPRAEAILGDVFHSAEKLTGLARLR